MGDYFHIFNMDTFETIGTIPNKELMMYACTDSPMFVEVGRLMLPSGQWNKTRILFVGDDCIASKQYASYIDEIKAKVPEVYEKAFSLNKNEDISLNDICLLLLPKEIYGGQDIRYIFNHHRAEYIDLHQIKDKENTVHPLYLLTLLSASAELFHDGAKDIAGLWCGQPLSTSDTFDFGVYEKIDLDFMNK